MSERLVLCGRRINSSKNNRDQKIYRNHKSQRKIHIVYFYEVGLKWLFLVLLLLFIQRESETIRLPSTANEWDDLYLRRLNRRDQYTER